MKKFLVLTVATILLLSFTSCGAENAEAAHDTAKQFIQIMYTVDKSTADSFAELQNFAVNSVPDSAALSQMDTNINQIFGEKFSVLTTAVGIKDLAVNRTYTDLAMQAAQKGFTLEAKDVVLQKGQKEKGYIDYTYDVVVTVTNNKDKSTQTQEESGIIALVDDNGSWKVNFVRIYTLSPFLRGMGE